MTDEDRQRVYNIIGHWSDRHDRVALELVADLRDAGFPIVTWSEILAEVLA